LPQVDALVVSLKIRTVPVGEAVEAARAAASALAAAGAAPIYFKYCSTFDSTPEGNIGPVTDALLEQLGAHVTVACPAYPSMRRTVYHGHLFVGDALLCDSPMRDHPLTPMTDANLCRVVGRQSRSAVALVPLEEVEQGPKAVEDRLMRLDAGRHIAVVDAVFDRHVETIGLACRQLPLVTGGAALGAALARSVLPAVSGGANEEVIPRGRVAILSGSSSAATCGQVDHASGRFPSRRVTAQELASDEIQATAELVEWACEQARHGPVMISSTADPASVKMAQQQLGRERAAALIEGAFATVARALAADGVRVFIVAGGETSGAVLNSLGIAALSFGDEIEPGVPWTASLDPPGFYFALKSGNFGGPAFFSRALEMVSG
jgi:uncharacterized protein YgbK (DUF1537 family)